MCYPFRGVYNNNFTLEHGRKPCMSTTGEKNKNNCWKQGLQDIIHIASSNVMQELKSTIEMNKMKILCRARYKTFNKVNINMNIWR